MKKKKDDELGLKKIGRIVRYSNSHRSSYSKNSSGFFKSKNSARNKTNNNILIKITSPIKNINHLKGFLKYDEKEINTIFDQDNNEVSKEEHLKQINKLMDLSLKPKTKAAIGYRLAFSMQGKKDPIKLKEAARKSILKTFGTGYEFSLTVHEDTKNNHVHVNLFKLNTETDKNLNINKANLEQLKVNFAERLNMLGIKAEHKRKTYPKKEKSFINILKEKKERNTFLIKDFGFDYYQHKNNNNPNAKKLFYLKVETTSGKVLTYWNTNKNKLYDNFKLNKLNIGDEIKKEKKESGEIKISLNRAKNKMFYLLKVTNYDIKDNELILNLSDYQNNKTEFKTKDKLIIKGFKDAILNTDFDIDSILKFNTNRFQFHAEIANNKEVLLFNNKENEFLNKRNIKENKNLNNENIKENKKENERNNNIDDDEISF